MKSLPGPGSAGPNTGLPLTSALLELAKANFSNAVAVHKFVLEFSRRQNEMVAGVAKQWVGSSSPAAAAVEIVERSVHNVIQIQRHFLDLYTPAHGETRPRSTFDPALPDAAPTQDLATRMQ